MKNARWLETLGMLQIKLGYEVGLGPAIGFKLIREEGSSSGARPLALKQR